MGRPRVLFFVEGFTDIRFVVGLSEICDLTLVVPQRTYGPSGLKQRIAESGIQVQADEISGGRLQFQFRSLVYLLKRARRYDVILAQEMLRGALNANIAGLVHGVPVVAYMGIAPAEYFRCRRDRRQISWLKWRLGDAAIRTLMTINGRLTARCLAMGDYLRGIALRYCRRSEIGLYYGVDTDFFRPADADERRALRRKRNLPVDRFLIFFSSRISHEKDAETVLQATAIARSKGLDAVVLNLGGGYKDFLQLAKSLDLLSPDDWVIGGPALHPMYEVADAFRFADVIAQASFAEGLGLSPLEALACSTPVVATAVGGMAVHLPGHARLTPPRDPRAMAREFLWIAEHSEEAPLPGVKVSGIAHHSQLDPGESVRRSGPSSGIGSPPMMRLAILPDFLEENWPSMDLCAEMLLAHLTDAQSIRPRFQHLFSRMPLPVCHALACNADRLVNRVIRYPWFLKRATCQFDFFHIADHSYAQLVHSLPPERTGVFCHDLDAFRCLLEPERDPRPRWFRALARRILSGLQKAAVVFHSTMTIRAEIEKFGLVDSSRLVHAPYGVAPEFTADGPSETICGPYLLHVGSNIPRKRIEVLLQVLVALRCEFPDLRLVKVGEHFTAAQQSLVDQLNLQDAIVRRERLTRAQIAVLYRGAAVVLLPSSAEGFGLPIVEALACGAPVLASDLPVLREVGGEAISYAPAGDVNSWVATTRQMLAGLDQYRTRAQRFKQAEQFSWANHARIISDAYERLTKKIAVRQ